VGEKRLGSGERREENEWTGARALPVPKFQSPHEQLTIVHFLVSVVLSNCH
jgi:hypothetical protein